LDIPPEKDGKVVTVMLGAVLPSPFLTFVKMLSFREYLQ